MGTTMARGFESKSVASQQESALEERELPADPGDPGLVMKRRTLELARANVVNQLETARSERHRDMLHQALAAVDEQLRALAP